MTNQKTPSKELDESTLTYNQKLFAIAEYFGIDTYGQKILLDRDTEGEYHISNIYAHSKKIEGFRTYTSPDVVIDEAFKMVSDRDKRIGAKNAKW